MPKVPTVVRLRRLSAVTVALAAVAASGVVSAPTVAAAADCPSPGGARIPEASASGPVVFRGHGWGHGLGMSQYGAQGAARLGCSYRQILTTYYRGSSVTSATVPRTVFLRMMNDGPRADVTAVGGPVTWTVKGSSAPGDTVVQPKGSTYRLVRAATNTRFRLVNDATGKTAWSGGGVGAPVRLMHSGTVVRLKTRTASGATYLDRNLRWDYTDFRYDGSWVDAVQVIRTDATGPGMDKYLWGVAEVPTLFPTAALKAQAVAARTYAARVGGGSFARPLMPTPADQNYTGEDKEAEDRRYGSRWSSAVDGTSGRVLKDGSGAYVVTYYSSSMGGYTEDVRYVGWSTGGVPYLTPVDDSRWDLASSNPSAYRSWARGMSWETLADRLGFSKISTVSVAARGSSARRDGVKVVGFRGGRLVTVRMDGWDVRQALGLLSPGFTIRTRTIGGPGATALSGDWDGDGDSDPGWWRSGSVALSMNGRWIERFAFGREGDVPVVGDWDRDGDDDLGIFRDGRWVLRRGLAGGSKYRDFRYGREGDRPVAGRWSRAGTGVGLVRGDRWFLSDDLAGGRSDRRFRFGRAADLPVAGDWNRNGFDRPGTVRDGVWRITDRWGGTPQKSFRYGRAGSPKVTGDWDGDGRTTAGVVEGTLFLLRNANSRGPVHLEVRFRG
jgi:SpoIID/LytB domain protein